MQRKRTPIWLLGLFTAVLGMTGCTIGQDSDDQGAADGSSSSTDGTENDDGSPNPWESESFTDPRMEVLVGTWEASTDVVGPHGSELTINEDGTAVLRSGASVRGPHEGSITLGSKDPHYFIGKVDDSGSELVKEFRYDVEADTILFADSGLGEIVHERTS
ncbi:hypothetical protein [Salininema proteolyticum]|uniref:DUF5640 domain-containing protein n=1 Tax=Salininema proteolyticum TaxID=1607685 RepID=A0ABV8U213_9ACTN